MRAGVTRADITPPVGIPMVGFAGREPSNAIHDPLTATALVVESNGSQWVLMACDLLQLDAETVGAFRQAIAEQTEIDPSRVLFACSHNHYGPDVDRSETPIVNAYREYLKHRFAGLVVEARNEMIGVHLGIGWGSSDIGINRRERRPNGSIVLGNNPDGPVDRQVAVVRIDGDDGRPLACLVNFACHPVCQSWQQRAISADYPGRTREVVEQLTGAKCLFLQGAAGNINPIRMEYSYEPARTLGTRLGCEVVRVWETIHPEPVARVASATRTVTLPRYRYSSHENAQRLADQLNAEVARLEAQGSSSGSLWWAKRRLRRVTEALESWQTGKPLPPVVGEVQAWRLGEVAFATAPAEVFAESGSYVKQHSPLPQTFFVGYANGSIGYLPTPEAYTEGGYEVTHACQVDPDAAPTINRTCLELLESLA